MPGMLKNLIARTPARTLDCTWRVATVAVALIALLVGVTAPMINGQTMLALWLVGAFALMATRPLPSTWAGGTGQR